MTHVSNTRVIGYHILFCSPTFASDFHHHLLVNYCNYYNTAILQRFIRILYFYKYKKNNSKYRKHSFCQSPTNGSRTPCYKIFRFYSVFNAQQSPTSLRLAKFFSYIVFASNSLTCIVYYILLFFFLYICL
ncbi:unnamed protein product [Aphis gossypii]|uniref:Uncharacterized protein n=1 Tax=Aphis gossypii TaxID=80765 RepID=A0A9P0IX29_APHGO|nr:unnamed protein product [Aphis gossypii]